MGFGLVWGGFGLFRRQAAPVIEPPIDVDAEVELFRWHDFPVEAGVAGNKYDVEASVLWQHEGGAQRQGLAWYSGSGETFVFRFGAELRGPWTGTTSSAIPELNGLTFSLEVVDSSNPERIGFAGRLPGEPTAWARQKGPDGALVRRTPRLVMWDHPRHFWDNPAKVAADVAEFADGHGFNGCHIAPIAGGWWDVMTSGNVSTGLSNPDPRTFEALEVLIAAWAERGGWVHWWQYGDGGATFHGLSGGYQGTVSRRLNRYIAARLGPVPGWVMGIGYDLDEWLTESQFAWWLDDIIPKLGGYHHWIGGRFSVGGDPCPVNEGEYPSTGIGWNTLRSEMQYASWEQWQTLTSNSEIDQGLQVVPDRPMCSEDRFRRRTNAWPQKDFGADSEILNCMERYAVRGVSAIYGRYINQTDTFRISDIWPNKADILALAQQIDDDGAEAVEPPPPEPGTPPEELDNLILGVDPKRSPITFGAGTSVSRIDDLGPNAKHFGQDDAALRPTLDEAGINGGPALRGQNDGYLYRTESLCWPAGDFAIYFLLRAPSQTNNRFYSEGNSETNTPYWALDAAGNKLRVRVQTDGGSLIADATTNATVFDDQPHIVCVSRSGGTGQVWVDGAADVTFPAAGTLSLNRSALLVRLRSTADFLFNGRLGPVYAYGEARSAEQAQAVEGYLAAYPDPPDGGGGNGGGNGGPGGPVLLGVHDGNGQPAQRQAFEDWLDPAGTGVVEVWQDVIRKDSWTTIALDTPWDRHVAGLMRDWVLAKPGRVANWSMAIMPDTEWGNANRLQQGASGAFDQHFTALANNLAQEGLADPAVPMIFRPGYEWDANWFPWGVNWNLTLAAHFREFWKRIVGRMREAQPDANWLFDWNPNNNAFYTNYPALLDTAWPGGDYVDIVGIDIYDRVDQTCTDFAARWNWAEPWLDRARDYAISRGKKMSIPEWGVWNTGCDPNDWGSGTDNAHYVQRMHEWINANAEHIHYHVYFNELAKHRLNPPTNSPIAGATFKELFGSA